MTKININEFVNYSKETIYEFLILQAETEFEISLPRISVAGLDPDDIVSFDYRDAAYAGQLLSQVAESFGYYTPCPKKAEYFLFDIICSNMEKLAEVLLLIAHGTTHKPVVKELFWQFQHASAAFLQNTGPGDVVCKTEGLLYLACRFYVDED